MAFNFLLRNCSGEFGYVLDEPGNLEIGEVTLTPFDDFFRLENLAVFEVDIGLDVFFS